mgnify:CR=1 FL=1
MKKLSILLLSLFLSGCGTFGGTYMYSGSGTFQNFANARFECSLAAQGTSSGGFITATSGSFSSVPTVNCGMMDACLASRGFVRDTSGSFDASSMKVRCSN